MSVNLVTVTPNAEKHIAYCARVSSANQDNPKIEHLIKYCIDHKHWSVFESSYMTLEIITSILVSRQILRHRSFTFQEFSQRYSSVNNFNYDDWPNIELRKQDTKNRQNSIELEVDNSVEQHYIIDLYKRIESLRNNSIKLYNELLDYGIAKECARAILPLSCPTKLEMTGNIRQWIHYIELRTEKGTQKEHRIVAEECKKVFIKQFPKITKALGWK